MIPSIEFASTNQQPTPLTNALKIPQRSLWRFLAKVVKRETGCWEWTGRVNPKGYGIIYIGEIARTQRLVHRVSYMLAHGPIDEALQIHHRCRNPRCVNPIHLEVLTASDHSALTNASWVRMPKTHCQNGHEFTEDNTRYTKNGKRVCRICNKAWQNARRARFREANPLPEKTHCINGHPLSGDNLYVYKTKTGVGRGCRICRRVRTHQNQARNRSMVKAKERVRIKIKKGKTNFSEMEKQAIRSMKNPPIQL